MLKHIISVLLVPFDFFEGNLVTYVLIFYLFCLFVYLYSFIVKGIYSY